MKLFLDINSTKKSGIKQNEYSEVDLGKNNRISLTHTFDSLTNPIDYVSEYSFEVLIPKTKRNNQLFDNIFRLDSYITDSTFDPNVKMKYYIQSDHNDVISRGLAYLNYVDEDNYHFNLLGSLNDIFTKYLNAGWDSKKALEDEKYYQFADYLKYDGQSYNDVTKLNRNIVYASWEVDPSQRIFSLEELQRKFNSLNANHTNLTNKEVYISNIIGFAIENQGQYTDFQSDKWMYPFGGVFKPINLFRTNETDDPYTLAEDGVTENQICEYRSYYQQPYIYINRLLEIFRMESKRMTEYDLVYDKNWFNENDFYLNQLVYMLPSMYSNANPIVKEQSNLEKFVRPIFLPSWSSYETDTGILNGIENVNLTATTESIASTKTFHIEEGHRYNAQMKLNLQYDMSKVNLAEVGYPKLNYDNPFYIHIYAKKRGDANDTILTEKKIVLVPTLEKLENISNTIGDTLFSQYRNLYDEVYEVKYDFASDWAFLQTNDRWTINKNTIDVVLPIVANETADIDVFVKVSYLRKYTPFHSWVLNIGSRPAYFHQPIQLEFKNNVNIQFNEQENYRSNQPLTMERIFKEVNPFEIILKFCKLTGKIWVVDDLGKKVTIYNRSDYFKKVLTTDTNSKTPPVGDLSFQGVYNITDLIDYSKQTKLASPSWNDRFLEFNFNDVEADLFKEYKSKYGQNYGSKKIVTTNQKNNNTKKLFCNSQYDTINPSMISGLYEISVDNIKANNVGVIQNYPQITNFSNGGCANLWNNFYFRNPNGRFDSGIGGMWRNNYVVISDDMKSELFKNVYAWHSKENEDRFTIKAYNRPRFNTYTWGDEVSIQFADTQEIYHQFSYLPTAKHLYENFFKNYIEQVYNFQSKKYEVYVTISSQLYRRLKANPFVQVQNTVFLCTQISDWNENNISTKVTLVQIQDLNQLVNYSLPNVSGDLLAFDSGDVIAFDNGDKILA